MVNINNTSILNLQEIYIMLIYYLKVMQPSLFGDIFVFSIHWPQRSMRATVNIRILRDTILSERLQIKEYNLLTKEEYRHRIQFLGSCICEEPDKNTSIKLHTN